MKGQVGVLVKRAAIWLLLLSCVAEPELRGGWLWLLLPTTAGLLCAQELLLTCCFVAVGALLIFVILLLQTAFITSFLRGTPDPFM